MDQLWLEALERQGGSAFPSEAAGEAPLELHKAINQFNSGLFWECHETLEYVWRNTAYPLRFFYHAIIKVAAGFHHMSRRNGRGARLKLAEGVRLLALFPPEFLGVRTDLMHHEATLWLERLGIGGPIDWAQVEALPIAQIRRVV